MLEIENLTIKKGLKTIISGLSFSVPEGSVTAVCGRNGSGKTSLLRAVVGVQKYEGIIRINGKDLSQLTRKERSDLVSYMPQVLPMPELSVRQLVLSAITAGGGLLALPGPDQEKKADEILAACELESLENSPVSDISGGERQRAYLAVLMACDTPVVLMDEPTSNLDEDSRNRVYGFIEELKAQGKSVVVVLHHESRARAVADEIVRL